MAVAIPFIALAITAGGAAASGISQQNAANYQSQVSSNNAVIAKRNADYSGAAGAAQTERASLKAQQQFGQVRASFAANNLDINSGSPADVQVGQREIGSLDTSTVSNNAALQAYGYETQAAGYSAQSGLESSEAQYDALAGGAKAAGTLIGNPSFDSLISGSPSAPPDYAWMQNNG